MDNFNIITDIHHVIYRKTFATWKIQKRTISDHEFVFVLGGKGFIKIEDKEYRVKPGMLFYFTPGIEHLLATDANDPMYFYAVHFDICKFNTGDLGWSIVSSDTLPIESVCTPNNFHVLASILKSLNMHWKNKLYGFELACNSLLQQFIYEVFNSTYSTSINYSSWNKINKIIDYIHDNIYNKITLFELAELSKLNYTYLSQLFKETTGYNIIDFINRLKIDKAKELILEGNYKIKDISQMIGFDDQFYFSRVFKNIEGISPSQYYKKYVGI